MNTSPRRTSRQAIVDAAILCLARNPGASLSEIALRAGVGRATLHRHFRGRDDLIRAIQGQCLKETDRAVIAADNPDAPAPERLLSMFGAVIPLGDRYHFLNDEQTRDPDLEEHYGRELKWVAGLVGQLKDEGAVAADVPSAWVLAQIDQLIWTAWCEVSAGRLDGADAPALAARTLLHGLS